MCTHIHCIYFPTVGNRNPGHTAPLTTPTSHAYKLSHTHQRSNEYHLKNVVMKGFVGSFCSRDRNSDISLKSKGKCFHLANLPPKGSSTRPLQIKARFADVLIRRVTPLGERRKSVNPSLLALTQYLLHRRKSSLVERCLNLP